MWQPHNHGYSVLAMSYRLYCFSSYLRVVVDTEDIKLLFLYCATNVVIVWQEIYHCNMISPFLLIFVNIEQRY